ncbi:MAG: aliphatic sulfonate ABC transporter substrate-binding protein [Drouetiella hepatica Uher 2000/2452]|jgi:sulfonate transport system substrate-binding protein|uniref:Putative aliphatic sulfonates-binding protein n=1 Tax=Drouetiella hepatica Uher 2000/2452 TaxID=904376 RepID=A0A951UL26_9CYAN|nr:aliphatic sulfonate ABC transporter substrate-binding protein [Drouetiella hepatica Uher 2000/2452]
MHLKRRTVLSGLIGLSIPLIASSCTRDSSSPTTSQVSPSAAPATSAGQTIHIGYQKATELDLLRTRGELDKKLSELGATAEWALFPSGPPMLEAMNAGKIDFGGVGESPPIFSQAAGGQFYYVSVTPLSAASQDIVVSKNSAIQTPADLKGKKVALQKGSSAHYLLLKALEEASVSADQVEVVSLSPADARAAFEQGNVDAWSIWDPFLAVAQQSSNIRGLNVGRERRNYFLASQQFAKSQSTMLKTVLEAAKENGNWIAQNIQEVAQRFSKDIKVDQVVLQEVYKRRSWQVLPVDAQIQEAQQAVADTFYKSKVIPKSVQVNEVFLPSEDYSKIFPS